MKIIENRLFKLEGEPCRFAESPNCSDGIKPEYLVLHYTAGRNAGESISWLTNPSSEASAHLVVARNGEITQLVPFNKKAWHAGTSSWEDRVGLNGYSLGIEIDNAGPLQRAGGRWRAWFGDAYDDSDVLETVHKNETVSRGWHLYTSVQIEAVLQVSLLMVKEFRLRDVLGHEDIAPGRKLDPGPAFPLASIRSRCMGRMSDVAVTYETTAPLNIRSGPGTEYATVSGSPLPEGTAVRALRQENVWFQVYVLNTASEAIDIEGWVHSRYLRRKE
jgi:N-acetylmuramoyl-L-alanine amidase